ncbi:MULTISPECIES: MarR family winged helix-turn-helix transcriptional regulator [Streptomyces]|uniref:MarR family winged helix-turn-helix transcriptional regulator n=1 Tax=Streptomyces TaxID=1883 RepID=UPI0006BAF75E|nr:MULTISPECIES: MarR family winged helix-turn-helix transcriptional regulator [Streptomyces]KPI14950.1 transcriptional regulator, MarR family [Actinobacteria bacterium OK006]MCX4429141.1 MarR family winged helix-turn-helix transcriptional regulator [Streptomyces mirabilis]MCX4429299.1 MarR family winged helix-turn-helix transcriptional regulator [Streptomyces mirabilis]QDN74746.1 winged helix-turn-helix transcriptional regulator [Streptomyces sp. S1A1-7]
MSDDLDPDGVASVLLASISVLVRRVRQVPVEGGLTMPERTALSHLDRSGPTTSSALAREVQITAQAMGATLSALQARGLVERRRDPNDGRRVVLTVTDAGLQALKNKRNARTELIARALTGGTFTPTELEQLAAAAPLLERLAQNI